MATLLLTAVGTAIGGPLGGAIGGLIGQQADRTLLGVGSREGPRLKELAVTTSSYGQPIGRHFGRMRVAGSLIWSTDLIESSSSQGGKTGGSTTTYSYSASFAVALSSTPIERIGRIWADGGLLRGVDGDLKVPGVMRFYDGYGDAEIDPIIAADRGQLAPAFRDCAYVVFESLDLADFGNRLPALSFEVFASASERVSLTDLVPEATASGSTVDLEHAHGFSDEGGSLASSLTAINRVFPITCATTAEGLRIASAIEVTEPVPTLPEQLSTQDSEDAQERPKRRAEKLGNEPMALRYYDEKRDYQPGVQRAIGPRPGGREVMLDLPASMSSDGAKQLANANAHRARWHSENITWRIGELDPFLKLGGVVRLPDMQGLWRVMSWEWYERGIELGLEKIAPGNGALETGVGSDPGSNNAPEDIAVSPTELTFFEAPPDETSNPSLPVLAAAASAETSGWRGATIYAEQAGTLVEVTTTSSRRSLFGNLTAPLEPSAAALFEPDATLELGLVGDDLVLPETDVVGLASGANRLLVGGELVQYCLAEPLGNGVWQLQGLLRGRAGTEDQAALGHIAGAHVVLLDDRITALDPARVNSDPSSTIAAIGRADQTPVYASLANWGLSRRPPMPVHPSVIAYSDGSWQLCWTRRARGHWRWETELEVPLVEASERYFVGLGPVDAPREGWAVTQSSLTLTQTERDDLFHQHGNGDIWVQQVGSFARSPALWLTHLV